SNRPRYAIVLLGSPMRRFVIAAAAFAGLAAATVLIGRTVAVDDEEAAKEAARSFAANLEKGDQKAVGGALDRRLTWTGADGATRNRGDTVKDLATFAAASSGDRDVQVYFYGRMLAVRGSHDNARFVRVFVKRRHGWKAFLALETPIIAA